MSRRERDPDDDYSWREGPCRDCGLICERDPHNRCGTCAERDRKRLQRDDLCDGCAHVLAAHLLGEAMKKLRRSRLAQHVVMFACGFSAGVTLMVLAMYLIVR